VSADLIDFLFFYNCWNSF